MILLKLYHSDLINKQELAHRIYPTLSRKTANDKLYNKVHNHQRQRITDNDQALAEKVWKDFVAEINS
jgi:hypothetical protein